MLATKTLPLVLSCVMILVISQTTLAQNTPQDYVNAHNKARSAVGVGNVSWNNTVQAYAQNYANKRKPDCQLIHSGGPYGENLFGGFGADFSGVDAVNAWVDEKQYYDQNTHTCASGRVCSDYKQVVSRSSTQIGCARVMCDNNGGIFIICSYGAGNYIGQSQPLLKGFIIWSC